MQAYKYITFPYDTNNVLNNFHNVPNGYISVFSL